MGLFGDVGKIFGGQTGFGGSGAPDPHLLDSAYSDGLYKQGIQGIQDASKPTAGTATGINSAAQSMLANLQNNSAGAKQQFGADMANQYGADMQNRAKAMGGTGNMAQAFMSNGQEADAHARAEASGINQINQAQPGMLGQITGTENALFNQNLDQAKAAGNMYASQAGAGNAMQAQNSQNMIGSDAAQQAKQGSTLGSIAGAVGSFFAHGGKVPGNGLLDAAKGRLDARNAGPHKVPGTPNVPGNSPQNDTVPALLSPDEIVIPNSVTHSRDPVRKGAQFIQQTLKNEGGKIDGLKGRAVKAMCGYDLGGGVGEDSVSSAASPEEETAKQGYASGGAIPAGQLGFYQGQNFSLPIPGGKKKNDENDGSGPTKDAASSLGGGIPFGGDTSTFGSSLMSGDGLSSALSSAGPAAAALNKGGSLEGLKKKALKGMKKGGA